MAIADKVKRAGVVGAGGGGFPTHVKLAGRADIVIANGAECEPLLHKDTVIMERQARELVAGMLLAMEAVGAKQGVVGVKGKKKLAVEAVSAACEGTPVRVHLLGDYYPAGDEYDLVYSVTGRLIPPAGIPLQVGAVVANVETLVNVAAAVADRAVTRKLLTVAGAVGGPATLSVPIGTSYRQAIAYAGGLTTDDPVLCIGGLMMGGVSDNLDAPIGKTVTGVIVLPRGHSLIQRKLQPVANQNRIGKSACDQCRYCTELCPRYLLGYEVEPHQVMRSLAFTSTGEDNWHQLAALCCACGLCTLYSCPELLFPKEACDAAKTALRARNFKWTGPAPTQPHGLREGRRIPIKSLTQKLAVKEYDVPAPFLALPDLPREVQVPLRQGAGVANQALVRPGDRVKEGQPLGEIPEGKLGAAVHAPFASRVQSVTPDTIVLERLA